MPESEHKSLHMQIETTKRWHNGKYKDAMKRHQSFMHNKTYAAKGVVQYSKDGRFICEYASAREAYRATGISYQHISAVCYEKRKYAGGYSWKFI